MQNYLDLTSLDIDIAMESSMSNKVKIIINKMIKATSKLWKIFSDKITIFFNKLRKRNTSKSNSSDKEDRDVHVKRSAMEVVNKISISTSEVLKIHNMVLTHPDQATKYIEDLSNQYSDIMKYIDLTDIEDVRVAIENEQSSLSAIMNIYKAMKELYSSVSDAVIMMSLIEGGENPSANLKYMATLEKYLGGVLAYCIKCIPDIQDK